jgi:hypothetical protein
MKLCHVLVLAGLLLFPTVVSAQFREPFPYARVTVTPLIAYRFPYVTRVEGTVYTATEVEFAEFRERRGGGTVLGGELEVRIVGPLSVVGGVGFAEPADNLVSTDGGPEDRFVGPEVWYYSAGLSLRLPEPTPDYRRFPLVASLSVAPALVREVPQRSPLPPDHPQFVPSPWSAISHRAVNVGFKSTLLLGTRHLALQFGLNDFITFWNDTELERQLEEAYRQPPLFLNVIADYNQGVSHVLQGHVGISFRY